MESNPSEKTAVEGDIYQGGVFGHGEGGKSGVEERQIVKTQKSYFKITLLISILLGIILPLTLGVKDPTLIAVSFSSIWFIYAIILFTTIFLIEGRRLKKKLWEKEKNDSFPLHDIQELQALYEITIKKDDEDQKKLWS